MDLSYPGVPKGKGQSEADVYSCYWSCAYMLRRILKAYLQANGENFELLKISYLLEYAFFTVRLDKR